MTLSISASPGGTLSNRFIRTRRATVGWRRVVLPLAECLEVEIEPDERAAGFGVKDAIPRITGHRLTCHRGPSGRRAGTGSPGSPSAQVFRRSPMYLRTPVAQQVPEVVAPLFSLRILRVPGGTDASGP